MTGRHNRIVPGSGHPHVPAGHVGDHLIESLDVVGGPRARDSVASHLPAAAGEVTVLVPDEPPLLTAEAARALLKVLLKAAAAESDQHGGGEEQRRAA